MMSPAFSFQEDSFLCSPNISQECPESSGGNKQGHFPSRCWGLPGKPSLCREHMGPQSPARGLSASGCLREFPAPYGGARESRAPFPRARFKPEAGFGCGLLTGPSRFLRKRRLMAPLRRARSRPSAGPGHLVPHPQLPPARLREAPRT